MSSRFVPFSYTPDSKGTPKPAPAESKQNQDFQAPSFEVHPSHTVNHVAHNIRSAKFELNSMVADAIGVEEEERAREEKKMNVELERRWEILKAKAEVEGFQAGLSDGKKEAYLSERPRIEEKLARLEKVAEEISNVKEKIYKANEQFLMELIAQVVRTVVLKEVELDKDYLKRVITTILNQTGAREDIRILVSEQDRQLLDGLHMILEKEFGKLTNTVIEIGPDISPGGCRVETRFGVVDASLQTQVDNIVRTLRNT